MLLSLLKSSTPSVPFPYEIVRSARRRSISIEIAKAQVVVRAPFFVAKAELEKFVAEKSVWVQQKLAEQTQELLAVPEHTYVDGSKLPFLGRQITLVVRTQPRADVVLYGEQLLVILSSRSRLDDEEQARRLVSVWYQEQALALLTEKTDLAAQRVGKNHSGVTIRATRSKWGHCTIDGAIQYNWQILLAPEAIVDYLVAHEVSHLRHHNHSAAFWALVASICPDYKRRRAWLKANGAQLIL